MCKLPFYTQRWIRPERDLPIFWKGWLNHSGALVLLSRTLYRFDVWYQVMAITVAVAWSTICWPIMVSSLIMTSKNAIKLLILSQTSTVHTVAVWEWINNFIPPLLTHWGRGKMATISQTTLSIFLNENVRMSIKISLKFVSKGPINNIPVLVQIMAWPRLGDKPLPEPMMVKVPTRHLLGLNELHDDVIKWKHFPCYWPFVWGIHRPPVNCPSQRPMMRSFDVFFDLHLE